MRTHPRAVPSYLQAPGAAFRKLGAGLRVFRALLCVLKLLLRLAERLRRICGLAAQLLVLAGAFAALQILVGIQAERCREQHRQHDQQCRTSSGSGLGRRLWLRHRLRCRVRYGLRLGRGRGLRPRCRLNVRAAKAAEFAVLRQLTAAIRTVHTFLSFCSFLLLLSDVILSSFLRSVHIQIRIIPTKEAWRSIVSAHIPKAAARHRTRRRFVFSIQDCGYRIRL